MNKSVLCSLACKLNQLSDQANCCLGSHFRDHWMVHVNSHKLRRVTYERTPAVNVIQNLFFWSFKPDFLESHKSYLLQQELFGASPPPAVALKRNFYMKIVIFQIFSCSHLIPLGFAPPSPSFGSFLAIARNMSFTFSCIWQGLDWSGHVGN